MIVDHITHFVDIRILLSFFSFFHPSCMCIVQGGAEPIDTFQMVIVIYGNREK